MKTLALYLLETLACSGVLLAAYTILLERRVKFRWCRAYLLLSTILAGIIPLLRIPVWPAQQAAATQIVLPEAADWTAAIVPEPASSITPELICTLIYAFGCALILGLILWQALRIRSLRRGASITRTDRFTLVRTPRRIASFSFFRSIYVWNETPEEQLAAIVAHEASHIAHRHSAERMAMECLKAALWWNPFVWITARRLTEAEEFEADNDVLTGGFDIERYMTTIFKQLFGYSPDIANGLRDSLTKKRFKMMTTKTPSRYALLRLAATLPAVIGLLCAFSFTTRAAGIIQAENPVPAADAPDQTTKEVRIMVRKDKAPLEGAAIVVTGTKKGAVTDKEGTAQLNVRPGALLDISFIGCRTEQVQVSPKAGGSEVILVTLQADGQKAEAVRPAAKPASQAAHGTELDIYLMGKDGSFSSGNRAEGATVQVVGGTAGVVADKEGKARIDAAEGTVLEIKYPGYEPAAVAVGEEPSYFVMLRPEGMTPREAPIYSRDSDGVKQTPLYIVDGVEQAFSPDMNVDDIESIQVLKNQSATALYGDRGKNGVVVITTKNTKSRQDKATLDPETGTIRISDKTEDAPMLIAETMPQFQEGDLQTFRQWVLMNLKYPKEAMEKKIQGRVILSFIVETDGSVSNIVMLQSPDKLLSDEARRVIASSPAWTPGRQRGEVVRVKYTLPVDFQLTGGEKK